MSQTLPSLLQRWPVCYCEDVASGSGESMIKLCITRHNFGDVYALREAVERQVIALEHAKDYPGMAVKEETEGGFTMISFTASDSKTMLKFLKSLSSRMNMLVPFVSVDLRGKSKKLEEEIAKMRYYVALE